MKSVKIIVLFNLMTLINFAKAQDDNCAQPTQDDITSKIRELLVCSELSPTFNLETFSSTILAGLIDDEPELKGWTIMGESQILELSRDQKVIKTISIYKNKMLTSHLNMTTPIALNSNTVDFFRDLPDLKNYPQDGSIIGMKYYLEPQTIGARNHIDPISFYLIKKIDKEIGSKCNPFMSKNDQLKIPSFGGFSRKVAFVEPLMPYDAPFISQLISGENKEKLGKAFVDSGPNMFQITDPDGKIPPFVLGDESLHLGQLSHAMNYCKERGARLPTKDELNVIDKIMNDNKTVLSRFGKNSFWSSAKVNQNPINYNYHIYRPQNENRIGFEPDIQYIYYRCVKSL